MEVAGAYFPKDAWRERTLGHSSLARCLWYGGHFPESAAQFEAGFKAAREGQDVVPKDAANALAAAAARAHFECGSFDAAAKFTNEATGNVLGQLVAEAVQVVDGSAPQFPVNQDGTWSAELEATLRLNRLVAQTLPDNVPPDLNHILDGELTGEGPLARVLAPPGEGEEPPSPSLERMALRTAAGELGAAVGVASRGWARPMLASALKDFEALHPGGPTMRPLYFRALSALGSVLGQSEPVTAEGLFRSAVDRLEEAMLGANGAALSIGRGPLWRAQVYFGFAELLEHGRHADRRATEIAALREKGAAALKGSEAAMSPRERRWALVWLPPPRHLDPEQVGF